MSRCIFCGKECDVNQTPNHHELETCRCASCGVYISSPIGLARIISNSTGSSDKFKIACVLNERRLKGFGGIVLSIETDKEAKVCGYPVVSVKDVLDEFPKKASDFLNRTLLNLSRLAKRPFEVIKLNMDNVGNRLHLFTPDTQGCYAFLRELAEQKYIRFNEVAGGPQWDVFFLTTKFWEIAENLQKEELGNKRACVAMWFDKSMDAYYKDGIKQAIKDAGYVPVRIDLQDFNEKICDEIIAEIKRCKFLVSDFSGQRCGVYFEAGFAKGLGRPVIFTVKKDDVEKLHFDTRQYNHIVYDSPEDLHKKLYNRICATIV